MTPLRAPLGAHRSRSRPRVPAGFSHDTTRGGEMPRGREDGAISSWGGPLPWGMAAVASLLRPCAALRVGRLRAFRGLRLMSTSTSESYVKSIFPPVPPIAASATIPDVVMASWSSFGDRPAVIDAITGDVRTFSELRAGVDSLASHLTSVGLKHGDRIALVSPNHADYGTVLLAAMKIGVTVSPMNPVLTAGEMAVQMRDADIKMVIAAPGCSAAFAAAAETSAAFGTLSLGEALAEVIGRAEPAPPKPAAHSVNDVALLPYSSGTTGVPKGTMLSHRNIIANLHQIVPPDGAFYQPDDVLISPLPMFHIYPLTVGLLFHLWRGHTYVSMSGPFSIANFCRCRGATSHRHAVTPSRRHAVTPSRRHTAAPLHRCTAAPSHTPVQLDHPFCRCRAASQAYRCLSR